MKKVIFSIDENTIELWQERDSDLTETVYNLEQLKSYNNYIILVDYDSVAHELNKLIITNNLPDFVIVLERVPAIATGRYLITHGVKAYGNSMMLKQNYEQMVQTVSNGEIWTYPELTAALIKSRKETIKFNKDKTELLKRLTPKERDVLEAVLNGFTNETISKKLGISERTVKAHISSIFDKLHVNDRLSLVLLLLG